MSLVEVEPDTPALDGDEPLEPVHLGCCKDAAAINSGTPGVYRTMCGKDVLVPLQTSGKRCEACAKVLKSRKRACPYGQCHGRPVPGPGWE